MVGDTMLNHIENLELLDTRHGISVLHGTYTDRPSHALIFRLRGVSRYSFGDLTLPFAAGEVLFVPKGSSYETWCLSEEGGSYCLVNFQARIPNARPTKLPAPSMEEVRSFCARLEKCRVLDTAADRYRFTALFYEILSRLVEESRPEYRPSGALRRLDPAVEWLKNNLFDPQLRVGELHHLCGMSDAYFRRLFLTRFGVTPKKYVLTHRLSHARAILRSGEYNSIAEVAALSGFDDALYFSKAYRAAYGAPPSRETEEMA